jgi:hypothetical protein
MAPLCRVMPLIQRYLALRASLSDPPVVANGSTMTLAGKAWAALWPLRRSYRPFQHSGIPAYAMFLFRNYRNPVYTHLKDAPIVAAAKRAEVDYLVSLDRKHLVGKADVADRSRLNIVLPSELLRTVREERGSQ